MTSQSTPGDLTPIISDRVHYWVDRRVAEERARIVAWLRKEALEVRQSGSLTGPEWHDALRWAASKIESGT